MRDGSSSPPSPDSPCMYLKKAKYQVHPTEEPALAPPPPAPPPVHRPVPNWKTHQYFVVKCPLHKPVRANITSTLASLHRTASSR
jgi:hypothetical protein